MRFWQENRKLILLLGFAIILFAMFRPLPLLPWPISDPHEPVLSWPWRSKATLNKAWVVRTTGQLKEFFPRGELEAEYQSLFRDLSTQMLTLAGFDPSQLFQDEPRKWTLEQGRQSLSKAQRELTDHENQLRNDYRNLEWLMAHVTYPPYRVPRWEEEPGFYFLRILRTADTELDEIRQLLDPKKAGIPVYDKTLGFNMEIPPPAARTPYLLVQLGIIRDVTELALRCGISRVNRVSPFQESEEKGSRDELFFSEYPIGFGMAGTLPNILKFISALNGVHGQLTVDEKESVYYVDRGAQDGLRQGERMIVSRANEFVAVATVAQVEKRRGKLILEEVTDGIKRVPAATGDRVDNHFYKLRAMEFRPTQDPRFVEDHLELSIDLAIIKFQQPSEMAKEAPEPSLVRGGSKPPGTRPAKAKPQHGESRYNYKY